jgi:hypothetical protein
MEAITQVRKVPYVVQRPVTETMTRKVPVQNQRWVKEMKVRKVPIQTTRMIYETRKEPQEVRYYETEAVTRTVRRPVTRKVYVPYDTTVMVPRQVVQRTPLSYYDPFSPAIASGYSSFSGAVSTPSVSSPTIVSQPEPASSISEPHSEKPQTSMKSVIEKGEEPQQPESDPNANGDLDEPLELNPADPADEDLVPQPTIEDAKFLKAGWKIRFEPSLVHEI